MAEDHLRIYEWNKKTQSEHTLGRRSSFIPQLRSALLIYPKLISTLTQLLNLNSKESCHYHILKIGKCQIEMEKL
jgi:hypothetical protein